MNDNIAHIYCRIVMSFPALITGDQRDSALKMAMSIAKLWDGESPSSREARDLENGLIEMLNSRLTTATTDPIVVAGVSIERTDA